MGNEIAEAKWRTGSVCHADSHEDLGAMLRDAGRVDLADLCRKEGAAAVVISQWCDLVHNDQEHEPFVEVLIATPHEATQDDHQPFLRSYRVLDVTNGGRTLRLRARDRTFVRRELLLKLKRDEYRELSLDEAMKVQQWLGTRYQRFPLPEALARRLNLTSDPGRRYLDKLNQYTTEIRIRVVPEDEELDEGKPYMLVIYVVAIVPLNNQGLVQAYDKFKTWAEGLGPGVVAQVHLTDADQFTLRQAYATRRLSADTFTFRQAGKKGPHPMDAGDGV